MTVFLNLSFSLISCLIIVTVAALDRYVTLAMVRRCLHDESIIVDVDVGGSVDIQNGSLTRVSGMRHPICRHDAGKVPTAVHRV